MTEKVENYQIGTKYKVRIERAASTKGVLGYVIEASQHALAAERYLLSNFVPETQVRGLRPQVAKPKWRVG